MIENIKNLILEFFFPENCIACGGSGTVICQNCFDKIPHNPSQINGVLYIYDFKNPLINKLIWKLKYHHSGDVAKFFGRALALEIQKFELQNPPNPLYKGALSAIEQSSTNIFLIPIPLSSGDKRMHNHAELIANAIAQNLENGNVLPNLLIKNTKIKQAHTKSKTERFENVRNCFSVNPKCLPPPAHRHLRQGGELEQNIYIIIDDVTTTGATINEARKIFEEYLNSKVFAITVAH